MADPASGLVQHFADRILQTVPSRHIAHHGKLSAVRRPIGPLDVLQHFTRSTADQGHARESSAEDLRLGLAAAEQQSRFPSRRNTEDLSPDYSDGAGLRSAHASGKDFHGPPLPRRTVDHGLPVRCESGHADRAPAIGQEMIRRDRGWPSVLDEEESHPHCSQQRDSGQRERSAVTTPRNHVFGSGKRGVREKGCSLFRASFGFRRACGNAGGIQFTFETLQIAADLGGTLIAQLNILFQGLADEALRFRRQIGIQADGSGGSTVENRFRNDARGLAAKW